MKKSKIVLLALCGICSQLTFADESVAMDNIESYSPTFVNNDTTSHSFSTIVESSLIEKTYRTQYAQYQESMVLYKKQYSQYQKDLKKYNKDNAKVEKIKAQLNKKMMYACKTGQLDGIPPFACSQSLANVYAKLYLYPAAEAKYHINLSPQEPEAPIEPIAPVKIQSLSL